MSIEGTLEEEEALNKTVLNEDNNVTQNINKTKEYVDSHISSDKKCSTNSIKKIPTQARTTLWYLAFLGFAINYMLRVNLNIAIVDMVQKRGSSSHVKTVTVSECYNNTANIDYTHTNISSETSPGIQKRFSFERTILKFLQIDYNENGFEWDEYQQNLILGSFFWMHWVTTIPGGVLARKYGTKLVLGLGNFLGCALCSLMPIVSFIDYRLLIFLRIVQGFIAGVVWPSMFNMIGQWIPPNERSTFSSSTMGSSVGIAVFYPFFGYLMVNSSWEWVFHLCTIAGVMWFIAWQYFVFDSPAAHPRIDEEEKDYILKSLGTTIDTRHKVSTPWKEIATSIPVWILIISFWGGVWGLFTFMTQSPTYFTIILGWDIGMVGLLSGLPHLLRAIFSYVFSMYCDYLLRSKKLSTTNVRKLAVLVSHIVCGFLTLGLAYSGCNSFLAVLFLTGAISMTGTVAAGVLAAQVDISPNFASVICGITVMVGVVTGFISPIVVGKLTLNNQTVEQWKYVYLIAAVWLIGSGALYIFFANSDLAHWNSIPEKVVEMENLEKLVLEEKNCTRNEEEGNGKMVVDKI